MFEIKSSDEEARVGQITLQSGSSIITPSSMIYSYRGGAVNLTTDLLNSLQPDNQAMSVDALQFVDQIKLLEQYSGSGRDFLSIDPSLALIVTSRDPCMYEYSGVLRQSTDEWASVSIHRGGQTVTPAQYMSTIAALAPDAFVVLSDDVPCDSKSDRATASVNRTIKWLQQCLEMKQKSSSLANTPVIATVQGGQYVAQRQRCVDLLEPFINQIAGYCIGGLGTGESRSLRKDIIGTVLKSLPAEAPRVVTGIGSPEEVLEAVCLGIDLFDTGFPAELAAGGYALNFPIHMTANKEEEEAVEGAMDDTKLNLWSPAYTLDTRPFVADCTCLACSRHTRAYVHHLLNAHEMTAQVLLEAHNTRHYARFFGAIQRAIADGKLKEYREWFLNRKMESLSGV